MCIWGGEEIAPAWEREANPSGSLSGMSLLRNRSLASETQAKTELRESQGHAYRPEQQENSGDPILPLTAD